jgi:hypothetical protein
MFVVLIFLGRLEISINVSRKKKRHTLVTITRAFLNCQVYTRSLAFEPTWLAFVSSFKRVISPLLTDNSIFLTTTMSSGNTVYRRRWHIM